tara:strand:- start:1450 stop:2793 length:1344 start_codon:yes stop_codon:yes gene_type:complete
MRFMFNVVTAGTTARLPEKIDSLIERVELLAGGVQLSQGLNSYNQLRHVKDALSKDHNSGCAGHPEIVRNVQYAAQALTLGVGAAPPYGAAVLAGAAPEDYTSAAGGQGATVPFSVEFWEGILGTIEPSIIDTSILPDLTLVIYLAPNDVISCADGVLLAEDPNAGASPNGCIDTNAVLASGTYTLSHMRLNLETLGLADSMYDNMIARRIGEVGYIEMPFKQYFSFNDVHTGSSRFTVSSQSLDRLWCCHLLTGGKAAPTTNIVRRGHKRSGAWVDLTTGAGATNQDIGVSSLAIGGQMGKNNERYTSSFFVMRSGGGMGVGVPRGLNLQSSPSFQFQLNGAFIPQYQSTTEEMYQVSKNSLLAYEVQPELSLDDYKWDEFVQCVRLNLPESEYGRQISGLDTRGISLNGFYNTTGYNTTGFPLIIFAEVTSTLRVGSGRALEVIV